MPDLKLPVLFSSAAVSLFVSFAAATSEGGAPKTRREFAETCGRIEKGMSKAQVRSVLGKPDDTRNDFDPVGGTAYSRVDEEWRYGTSGHLTTATLGQVYFSKDGRVCDVYGKGVAPPDGMFDERDLRRMLNALGGVPSYNASGNHYDPRKVIRAVNLLQPLGKDKALTVINEFLRVTSHWHDTGRDGVFLVLRTLFEVPDDTGYMRHMIVGQGSIDGPNDPKILPRKPIAIEGDIPFKIVSGYSIFGTPESPEQHTAYFREHGKLRDKPLVPTDDPVSALSEFMKSPRWRYTGSDGRQNDDSHADHNLYEQLLRLLDTVLQPEPNAYGSLFPWDEVKARKLLDEVARLNIKWDGDQCAYTFQDGTTLPKLEPKIFARNAWKPDAAEWDVELIIQRGTHASNVTVTVCETYQAGDPVPAVMLRVVDLSSRKTIAKFKAGDERNDDDFDAETNARRKGNNVGHSFGKGFALKEGGEVQAELIIGDRILRSPIFKP
jgi:hypothetical protein